MLLFQFLHPRYLSYILKKDLKMPAPTPGYVKNMIRRSLREILDPSPKRKEFEKIWEFFKSQCAYCGLRLKKKNKEGHIDHLVSASSGGANHISNRVLSCANCNEKEKLDMPWTKFLLQKNPDNNLAAQRREQILIWQKQNSILPKNISAEFLKKIQLFGDEIAALYDAKVDELRNLRNR